MTQLLHGHTVMAVIQQGPIWNLYHVRTSVGRPAWLAQLNPSLPRDHRVAETLQECFNEGYGLQQASVVELLQMNVDEEGSYFLYAHSDGTPLQQIITIRPPDPETVQTWIIQICRALQQGYLSGRHHGCLGWPALFVTGMEMIQVGYFGTGRLFAYASRVWPEPFFPYAKLASPQRLNAPDQVNIGDELYSVGVIYYRLLTGQPLFQSTTMDALLVEKGQPWQPRETLSDRQNEILARLLAIDPSQRYTNCREVLNDLQPEDLAVIESISAAPEKHWTTNLRRLYAQITNRLSPTWVGVKRRMAFSLLLLAALAMIGLAVTWISQLGEDDWVNQSSYQAFINEQDSTRSVSPEPRKEAAFPAPVQRELAAGETKVMASPAKPSAAQAVAAPAADSTLIQFASLRITAWVDSTLTPADVYVNEKLIGQTTASDPLTVPGLVAGRSYTVHVRKQGYANWQRPITIRLSDENAIAAHLQPLADAMRRFAFSRTTFADRISIDGKLPALSLPAEADLILGNHELRYIDSASGFQWSTSITLDMNSSRTIQYTGDQVGIGQLSVVLADPGRYGYAFVFMPGQSKTQTTPLRQKVAAGRYPLRIFRDGFHATPSDTSVFIKPDQEISIVVQMSPM